MHHICLICDHIVVDKATPFVYIQPKPDRLQNTDKSPMNRETAPIWNKIIVFIHL